MHDHLGKNTFSNLNREAADRVHTRACSPYLFAVPTGADSVVVVTDGHPAEGAEERRDLNVEDVRQVPLKLSSCQKHLEHTKTWSDQFYQVVQFRNQNKLHYFNVLSFHLSTIPDALRAVHHHVDIGVGPSTSYVSCHYLDVVHDTWGVQLHVGLSHTASGSSRFMAPVLPQELSGNQISHHSRINDHRSEAENVGGVFFPTQDAQLHTAARTAILLIVFE